MNVSDEKIPNFRTYLRLAYEERLRRNPSYSMRAFARDLKISNQKLSRVLSGGLGLSPASAKEIAAHLKLDRADTDMFVTMVQAEHGRSEVLRKYARSYLQQLQNQKDFKEFPPESVMAPLDWYDFPILSLFMFPDTERSVTWVSERLGLDEDKVEASIKKLSTAGLLIQDENGRWQTASQNISIRYPEAAEQIRTYYKAMLGRAEESIEKVESSRRKLSVSMLALNHDDYMRAQGQIDEFCLRLVKEIGNSDLTKSRVYMFSTQLFPIERSDF